MANDSSTMFSTVSAADSEIDHAFGFCCTSLRLMAQAISTPQAMNRTIQ